MTSLADEKIKHPSEMRKLYRSFGRIQNSYIVGARNRVLLAEICVSEGEEVEEEEKTETFKMCVFKG